MTDQMRVDKVREALYYGCVMDALSWAESIDSDKLRREMLTLIREYDRG